MSEITKTSENVARYEYKEITSPRGLKDVYAENYPNFGWELDSVTSSATGLSHVCMRFKRERNIRNKAELSRLQRQFEADVAEIKYLEKTKKHTASITAFTVGSIGIILLAGATFAVVLTAMIPLMIVLAVPGFVCCFLSCLLYKKIKARKSASATPLIEEQYISIYDICTKGHVLLAEQF